MEIAYIDLVRRAGRMLARAALVLVGLILLFLTAVFVGALVPANPGWRPPEQGVTIFIRTNGVHTGVMVPARAAGIDWRRIFPASDIRDPRLAGEYFAIGWGNREFYLNSK